MKKFYGFIFCLFLAVNASAQQADVAPADDDVPNLGRQAKPLDKIRLTPDELPDVSVSLEEDTPTAPSKISKPTEPRTPITVPSAPSQRAEPISLGQQRSNTETDQMSQQLNAEIQRYQAARAKAELEKKAKARVKTSPVPEPQPQEDKMPDSVADMFGKVHDVYGFDISGFALGMTPEEIVETATENGYAVTKVEHGIPLHRTSFYEHNCRNAQVHRVLDLQNCIIDQAKKDEIYYVSALTLVRPATAEYVQVLFSTHATDNVAYKIYYENKGDNSLNFTRKNLAKKIRRRDAFWNMVFETYGNPDDPDTITWGDPQKAYMMARMQGSNYNAYLILEDKEIPDGDYKDADEQKDDLHYRHTFTFAPRPEDED